MSIHAYLFFVNVIQGPVNYWDKHLNLMSDLCQNQTLLSFKLRESPKGPGLKRGALMKTLHQTSWEQS